MFSAPRWLRDLGIASWFLVGVGLLARRADLGARRHVDDRRAGRRRRRRRDGRVARRQLAAAAPRAARARCADRPARARGARRPDPAARARRHRRRGRQDLGAHSAKPPTRSRAGCRASASTRPPPRARTRTSTSSRSDAISTLGQGRRERDPRDRVARVRHLVHGLRIFFLLKDGPALRAWLNRHLGVPRPVAETITGGVVHSIRRYFLGVTIVAAFNAVVVGARGARARRAARRARSPSSRS